MGGVILENRYKLTIDLKSKMLTNNTLFKQGNAGTSVLEITIVDEGLPVNITGQTVQFNFLRSDNAVVSQDSTTGVTILDALTGKFECVLKAATLAIDGKVEAEIVFTDGVNVLSSTTFVFYVDASIGFFSIKYISSIVSALAEWQTTFTTSQNDRTTTFNASEASRSLVFNTAEELREISEASRITAEDGRETTFAVNEAARANTFSTSQNDRTTTFNASEASRSSVFNTAEGLRDVSEDLREERFEVIQTAVDNVASTLSLGRDAIMTSTYIGVGNESFVPINLPSYNPDSDYFDVIYNGEFLTKDMEYAENENGLGVDLLGWTLDLDDIVVFRVHKAIVDSTSGAIAGSQIQAGGVTDVELSNVSGNIKERFETYKAETTNEYVINFDKLPAPYTRPQLTSYSFNPDGSYTLVGVVYDCATILNQLLTNSPPGTIVKFPTTGDLRFYAFADTVTVTKDNISFVAEANGHYNAKLIFTKPNSIFIDVQGSEFRSKYLYFTSSDGKNYGESSTQTAIRLKRPSAIADLDSWIEGNFFMKFNKAIDYYGRNMKMRNNTFSSCAFSIVINNVLDGTWAECRGHEIHDNRFHSNGGFGAGVTDSCAILNNSLESIGIDISDNHMDDSRKFYYGSLNSGKINDNYMQHTANTVIEILAYGTTSGTGEASVCNNTIIGRWWSDLSDKPNVGGHGIVCNSSRVAINNNTLGNIFGHGILINGLYNQVKNNTIIDCDMYTGSTYDGIHVNDGKTGNSVKNNTIIGQTMGHTQRPRYGIYCIDMILNNVNSNDITLCDTPYNTDHFSNVGDIRVRGGLKLETLPYDNWDATNDRISFYKRNGALVKTEIAALKIKGSSLAGGGEKSGFVMQVMANGVPHDGLRLTWDQKFIFDAKAASVLADMGASQAAFWIDQATNNLKVVALYSDGATIKTGTVCALT